MVQNIQMFAGLQVLFQWPLLGSFTSSSTCCVFTNIIGWQMGDRERCEDVAGGTMCHRGITCLSSPLLGQIAQLAVTLFDTGYGLLL